MYGGIVATYGDKMYSLHAMNNFKTVCLFKCLLQYKKPTPTYL